MLFQQMAIRDGHAAIDRFAHVVNGEQSHLNRRQRFHLDPCRTDRFHGCGTKYIASPCQICLIDFEINSNSSK